MPFPALTRRAEGASGLLARTGPHAPPRALHGPQAPPATSCVCSRGIYTHWVPTVSQGCPQGHPGEATSDSGSSAGRVPLSWDALALQRPRTWGEGPVGAGGLASEGPPAPTGPASALVCPLQQAGGKVGQTWVRRSELGPDRAGCSSGNGASNGGWG